MRLSFVAAATTMLVCGGAVASDGSADNYYPPEGRWAETRAKCESGYLDALIIESNAIRLRSLLSCEGIQPEDWKPYDWKPNYTKDANYGYKIKAMCFTKRGQAPRPHSFDLRMSYEGFKTSISLKHTDDRGKKEEFSFPIECPLYEHP